MLDHRIGVAVVVVIIVHIIATLLLLPGVSDPGALISVPLYIGISLLQLFAIAVMGFALANACAKFGPGLSLTYGNVVCMLSPLAFLYARTIVAQDEFLKIGILLITMLDLFLLYYAWHYWHLCRAQA